MNATREGPIKAGWLPAREAADRAGLARYTILTQIRRGRLPAVREKRLAKEPWFVHESDLAAYLEGRLTGHETWASRGRIGPQRRAQSPARTTRTVIAPGWLTVEEAAEKAGMAEASILRLVNSGDLPAAHVLNFRLIHQDDLDAYLMSSQSTARQLLDGPLPHRPASLTDEQWTSLQAHLAGTPIATIARDEGVSRQAIHRRIQRALQNLGVES